MKSISEVDDCYSSNKVESILNEGEGMSSQIGENTKYYVYQKWQARGLRVRIHLESCSHCNYGKGQGKEPNPKHARWHGPFSSLEQAWQEASSFGEGYDIRNCLKCL